MANAETLRCFIALPVPAAALDACAQAANALQAVLPEAKWSRREGIHLTLLFLGNVGRTQLPELTRALERAATGSRAIRLCTNGVEAFGRPGRPRVLWLDVGGELESLFGLQKQIEDACAALGIPPEDREFRPHLTLGRNKNANQGRPLRENWLSGIPAPEPVEWTAAEVVLYQSLLKPTGAEYTALATVPLAA